MEEAHWFDIELLFPWAYLSASQGEVHGGVYQNSQQPPRGCCRRAYLI